MPAARPNNARKAAALAAGRRKANLAVVPEPTPQLRGQTDLAKEAGFEAPEPTYLDPEKPATLEQAKAAHPASGTKDGQEEAPVPDDKPGEMRTSLVLDTETTNRLVMLQYAEQERTGHKPTLREYYFLACSEHMPTTGTIAAYKRAILPPSHTTKTEMWVPKNNARRLAVLKRTLTAAGDRPTAVWLYTQAVESFISTRRKELGIKAAELDIDAYDF